MKRAHILSSIFLSIWLAAPGAASADSHNPALARCIATGGAPDAGVPVTPEAQKQAVAAILAAKEACSDALEVEPDQPEALFLLGSAEQIAGNHKQAFATFERAAAGGLGAADTKLGDYYLFGVGVKPDLEKAVARFTAAADKGDSAAQTTLAILHMLGRGVTRDPGRTVELMTLAAAGGYHFAQQRLGQIYLTGEGIPNGRSDELGIPNPEFAATLFSLAAAQGNMTAIQDVANLYADDGFGVAENLEEHVKWTRRAADLGEPAAIKMLGFLYEQGRGVDKDPQRAAELYIDALKTGQVNFDQMRGKINGYTPGWDYDTAVAFQIILQDMGLYSGPIDGIVGWGTAGGARALAGQ